MNRYRSNMTRIALAACSMYGGSSHLAACVFCSAANCMQRLDPLGTGRPQPAAPTCQKKHEACCSSTLPSIGCSAETIFYLNSGTKNQQSRGAGSARLYSLLSDRTARLGNADEISSMLTTAASSPTDDWPSLLERWELAPGDETVCSKLHKG